MPLAVGETFAGYTIVRLIGSGGMGEVYLARHPRLPREDALKILRPELSSSEEFRQRFIREADLASALKHPNIVTVHDRGECAGQLWIATECVEGTDAAHLMVAKYPVGMPVEEAVAIITPIASALDFAHEKGLLHRDVKPANILLSQPDHTGHRRVFLADFGIARPTADPNGLTATNLTLGTVAYSAPEQLMGEPIDARADQYALAATAYHLLTGVQLFPNSNPAVVISHHLNAPVPSLSDTRAELAKLDPVLGVGLAKDPKGRFMRCADFAHALADRNSSPDSAVAPTQSAQVRQRPTPDTTKNTPAEPIRRGSSSRPWLMAAVAVAVLFAMVSAVVFWHPWSRDNPKAGVGTNTADPSPAVTTTTTSSTSLPPPPPATIAATPTAPSTTQAMTVSPTQQLSNYDVVFLQRLRDHGFPSDNPDLNISLASQVCLRLAHLSSQFPVPLHNEIPVAWYFYQREQSLGWTVDDWNFFVGNAVSSYCPEYR